VPKVDWITEKSQISYEQAVSDMESHVAAIRDGTARERIWLLEHPPIYTGGTSAKSEDLVEPDRFPVYQTGRGGEYTYHGPGQRIAYVMLDLNRHGRDVRQFVFNLEQWIIETLAHFDVEGERREGRIGIWVDQGGGRDEKIAALGIRLRKWVSFHGISINVNPDLEHFSGIVPCGIKGHGVTSLAGLGKDVSLSDVDAALRASFERVFSD